MKLLSGSLKGLKMSGLALLLAGTVASGLFLDSTNGAHTMDMKQINLSATVPIPPIDAGTMARTETATFALG